MRRNQFEEWPFADRLRFLELKNQIMVESRNFQLNFYNSFREQMADPDFMEKREQALKQALKDERKRLEQDRRRSSELGSLGLQKTEEKNRPKGEEKR